MLSAQKNFEKLLDFFAVAGELKKTIRFSAAEKIKGDSAADHSWRLALMVFTVAREMNLKIDVLRAMKIALIHDIAEAITGDIDFVLVAQGKVSKEGKQRGEKKAFEKIKRILGGKTGKLIYDLWMDFEEGTSREARFVKALDKLETMLNLVEMKSEVYDFPELIATYADKAVSDAPELAGLLGAVKRRLKEEFKKGGFIWKAEYNR